MKESALQQASDRRSAIVVGVLFIIATSFLFLGEAIYKPVLDAPDMLERAYPERGRIVTGILVEFTCILAMPLLAIVLFPVLRRHGEALAAGYVVFRALEGGILAIAVTNKLALVTLSEAYLDGGDADTTAIAEIAAAALATNVWGDTAGLIYNIVFIIGALILYTALYRFRLVPRFIPIFGFIGAAALTIAEIGRAHV